MHGKRKPVLDTIYSGIVVNQIIKRSCEEETVASPGDNIRENAEPFVCVSLDVKGCNTLESSLQKFVAGEVFTDYSWDPKEPRVPITKRQCLLKDKLPNSIIFHLKRFEFNLDTYIREKVNDSFSFPIETPLNIYPYTKEGLSSNNAVQLDNLPGGSGCADEASCLYTLTAVVVHTGDFFCNSSSYLSHTIIIVRIFYLIINLQDLLKSGITFHT